MKRPTNAPSLLALAGVVASLSACVTESEETVSDYTVPRPFVRTPAFDAGDRPVTEPIMLTPTTETPKPRVVSRQKLSSPPAPVGDGASVYQQQPGELRRMKIAVNQVSYDVVLRTILGPDGLDRSYVIDPALQQGNASKLISLDIDEEMTSTDLMDFLGGLGTIYGFVSEDRNGILYIRPAENMGASPVTPIMGARAAFESDSPVVRVRRLRHLSAADAQSALGELLSEGGSLVNVGNTLLIIDTVRQANRLSSLLAALDVPEFDGVEIWTYELVSQTPESASTLLQSILEPTKLGGGGTDPVVAFVPIPGQQNLMVISRDPSVHPYVRDLIGQIDIPPEADTRFRYLYRIQYYNPQQLVSLIEEFFAEKIESPTSQAGSGGQNQGAPTSALPMRLVLDEEEDLLLILATPRDYADLLGTLRMIDRPRQQVALNSIIAEVSLRDELEYGVEYFLQALESDGLGILELAGGTSSLLSGNPTGAAFFTGGDGFAVIQALQRETDVNILSQPRLTVRDGSQAIINVGGETPVPEGDVDTETGGLRRDITYRSIGITLDIQPEINESGDVTLEINQEIADVVSQGELGPEFTTRTIETTVTVPHGQTLLIGGIIQTDLTNTKRKIPILGDIPGAGVAFTSEQNVEDRRELLLAVTPTIINSPTQGSRVTSEFLRAAKGVERALHQNMEDLQQGVLNFDDRESVRIPEPPRGGGEPYTGDVLAPAAAPAPAPAGATDPQSNAAPAASPLSPMLLPDGPLTDPAIGAPMGPVFKTAALPEDRWAITEPDRLAEPPVVWTPSPERTPEAPRWSIAALTADEPR